MPQTMTIEHTVKSLALEIGFDRVGITDAGPFVRDEAVAMSSESGQVLWTVCPGTPRNGCGG